MSGSHGPPRCTVQELSRLMALHEWKVQAQWLDQAIFGRGGGTMQSKVCGFRTMVGDALCWPAWPKPRFQVHFGPTMTRKATFRHFPLHNPPVRAEAGNSNLAWRNDDVLCEHTLYQIPHQHVTRYMLLTSSHRHAQSCYS